jgi:hypothetical protein
MTGFYALKEGRKERVESQGKRIQLVTTTKQLKASS